MSVTVISADLANPDHAAGIVDVLDSYASDPLGGGEPLSGDVRRRLIPALAEHPTTIVLLALDEVKPGAKPVGVAICFIGFSTFAARPLLNIHDLAVMPECRGQGVGRALLAAVEAEAIRRGCCKLTLEVLDENPAARRLYERLGFRDYTLGSGGATRFLTKPL